MPEWTWVKTCMTSQWCIPNGSCAWAKCEGKPNKTFLWQLATSIIGLEEYKPIINLWEVWHSSSGIMWRWRRHAKYDGVLIKTGGALLLPNYSHLSLSLPNILSSWACFQASINGMSWLLLPLWWYVINGTCWVAMAIMVMAEQWTGRVY